MSQTPTPTTSKIHKTTSPLSPTDPFSTPSSSRPPTSTTTSTNQPHTSRSVTGNSIPPYQPRRPTDQPAWLRSSSQSSNALHPSLPSLLLRDTSEGQRPRVASNNWQLLADLVADGTLEGRVGPGKSPVSSQMPGSRTLPLPWTIPGSRTGAEGEVGLLSSSPPAIEYRSLDEGVEVIGREGTGEPSHLLRRASPSIDTQAVSPSSPNDSSLKSKGTILQALWPPSPVTIAIFKCSLTYFIASLFTFVPFLASLLSTASETDAHGRITRKPAYSAHMVATIVVYFNPARTMGSMILSSRYCFLLAALAALVSMAAVGTIHLFDRYSPSQGSQWDWISELGDWVVCVVWIGGSMGGLAWSKGWVGNPQFNTGCSMAAVTLFTVVIKEGGLEKLAEVLIIVLIGATITNVVCYLVFPKSATTNLQTSISKSLSSFSLLLSLLTSTFLLSKPRQSTDTTLEQAIEAHATAFKLLKSDLAEAKHERVLDSRIRGKRLELYDAVIGSLSRLAQHLASLRGSIRLQEDLILAWKEGRVDLDFGKKGRVNSEPRPEGEDGDEEDEMKANVRLFQEFRDISGEPMEALVAICEEAFSSIHQTIHLQTTDTIDLPEIRMRLGASLKDFTQSSSRAIRRLYAGPRREQGIYHASEESEDEDSPEEDEFEGPNETVFLIYFFLFTLEEFAREMLFLLDTVHEINSAPQTSAWEQIKSTISPGRKKTRTNQLYKQFKKLVPIDPSRTQPPLFPRNQRHAPGTLLTPASGSMPSIWMRINHRFWAFGARIREPDMRYAIKVGVASAILAAPAYTEIGRPIFLEYRGEWALIAFFATMSPTLGQTNFLSVFRIMGTLLGAAVAVLFYTLFPDNEVVLPILGFLFSIPCYWIITQRPQFAQAGRFILLTYNLTCLYAYNQRERDLEVTEIAFRRSTSVVIGVVWAAIVSRYWWPFTARRELRMGLSDFCLDLSYLYSKLVTTYSRGVDPDPLPTVVEEDEEEPLLPLGSARKSHLNAGVREFMAMELHLHSQLSTLRELLLQTRNEPRLKGPFAFDFYNEVLLSCERMVDKLHSMRCVTTRDEWDNGIRRAFVVPVNKQRREMAGSVILYFYTLSAGFRLRTPLPPYLPPAEQARQRLVEAIRNLDVVKRRSVRGGGRHLLFFAYALAMQEVIAELEYLGTMLQDAFGVISQSTVVDFENLFSQDPGVTRLEERVV